MQLLKVNSKVKHINVKIHYIRELINSRVVELYFVPTEYNVADVLTKALAGDRHERHTNILLCGHREFLESNPSINYISLSDYMSLVSEESMVVSEGDDSIPV